MASTSDRVARAWLSTLPPTSTKYPGGSSSSRSRRSRSSSRRAAQIAAADAWPRRRCGGCPPRAGSTRRRRSRRWWPAGPAGCGCRRGRRSAGCGWRSRRRRRSSCSRTTRSKRRWPTQTSETVSPTRPIRTARMTSPGVSPTRAAAARSTVTRSWGRPVSCSARTSSSPRTRRAMACGALAQLGQPVEVAAEDADGDVGRGAAQPLVDAHAERRGEQHRRRPGTLATALRASPPPAPPAIARRSRLQHHQHVRDGVRHRIFGALGPAGAADHVLDLGELRAARPRPGG